MFIELVDVLRCPREHEETWMVAAFHRMSGRFVIKARLGCPVCKAEYPIDDGVADLRLHPSFEAPIDEPPSPPDQAEGLRIAALLNLTRPGGLVLLSGHHARHAPAVAELAQCRVISLNGHARLEDSELVATVLADRRLPFASSSIDGIALEDSTVGMAEISRVLKSGGRLLAPPGTRLGGSIRELASDESCVVAEAVGPLLNLRR